MEWHRVGYNEEEQQNIAIHYARSIASTVLVILVQETSFQHGYTCASATSHNNTNKQTLKTKAGATNGQNAQRIINIELEHILRASRATLLILYPMSTSYVLAVLAERYCSE